MAISESSRLHASLRKECIPVQRLIVNQVLPPSASDCKFCAMKRKVHNFSVCSNNQKFYFVGMLSMTCSPPFFF